MKAPLRYRLLFKALRSGPVWQVVSQDEQVVTALHRAFVRGIKAVLGMPLALGMAGVLNAGKGMPEMAGMPGLPLVAAFIPAIMGVWLGVCFVVDYQQACESMDQCCKNSRETIAVLQEQQCLSGLPAGAGRRPPGRL